MKDKKLESGSTTSITHFSSIFHEQLHIFLCKIQIFGN